MPRHRALRTLYVMRHIHSNNNTSSCVDPCSIVRQVRAAVEGQAGHAFNQYVVVSYATQVPLHTRPPGTEPSQLVAGTNFFLKINTGDGFVHARVFRSLPHAPAITLHSIQVMSASLSVPSLPRADRQDGRGCHCALLAM